MSIRLATNNDCDALVRIARRAIRATLGASYDEPQVNEWCSSFTPTVMGSLLAVDAMFVYEADGEPVGLSSIIRRADGDAELDLLYVDPEFSGVGVGRALVSAVASAGRARGARRLWADASRPAQQMLVRCGFEPVSSNAKELRGVPFDNVWMCCELTDGDLPAGER